MIAYKVVAKIQGRYYPITDTGWYYQRRCYSTTRQNVAKRCGAFFFDNKQSAICERDGLNGKGHFGSINCKKGNIFVVVKCECSKKVKTMKIAGASYCVKKMPFSKPKPCYEMSNDKPIVLYRFFTILSEVE